MIEPKRISLWENFLLLSKGEYKNMKLKKRDKRKLGGHPSLVIFDDPPYIGRSGRESPMERPKTVYERFIERSERESPMESPKKLQTFIERDGRKSTRYIDSDVKSMYPTIMKRFGSSKPSIVERNFGIDNVIATELSNYSCESLCKKCAAIEIREATNWEEAWNGAGLHVCRTCKDKENGIFKINGQVFRVDVDSLSDKDLKLIIDRHKSLQYIVGRYSITNNITYHHHYYSLSATPSDINRLRYQQCRQYFQENLYDIVMYVGAMVEEIVDKIDKHIEITKEERVFYYKMIPKVGKILL